MGRKKSSGGDSGAAARAAAEASRKAAEAAERAAREREERARQEFQQSLARVKNYTGQTAQQFVEGAKGELATTLGDMTSKYEKQLGPLKEMIGDKSRAGHKTTLPGYKLGRA